MDEAKFYEILLDKGLLALVGLLFGFVLSRALEEYKRQQGVLSAIGSERAKTIIEVLSAATGVDTALNALMPLKIDSREANTLC